jgi:tetratricopeptide (TPR) repeat protein
MSADKLNEAIAAFQTGDRPQAKALFQEVITADPNNDTAWYYFAALQDDPVRRRAALQRVLEINPQHERAREVLASMDAAQAAGGQPESPARTRSATSRSDETPHSEPAPVSRPGGGSEGFALPVEIPGAPARVNIGSLWSDWLALFLASVNVLLRKPGVYEQEIARGSWWRFWLLVGGVAVISALLNLIGAILFGSGILFGLLSAIITLILTPAVAYAGVWLSDFWAKRQGSPVPQGQHAITAALPYVPAAIVSGLLSNLIPVVGGLLGFIVSLYAYYIMGLGFQSLHQFSDEMQSWITVAMFVVGIIIGSIVLGIIVGIVAAPLALGALLR